MPIALQDVADVAVTGGDVVSERRQRAGAFTTLPVPLWCCSPRRAVDLSSMERFCRTAPAGREGMGRGAKNWTDIQPGAGTTIFRPDDRPEP